MMREDRDKVSEHQKMIKTGLSKNIIDLMQWTRLRSHKKPCCPISSGLL